MIHSIKGCAEVNQHNPCLLPTFQCTLQCMGHTQKCITGTHPFPISKMGGWKHTTHNQHHSQPAPLTTSTTHNHQHHSQPPAPLTTTSTSHNNQHHSQPPAALTTTNTIHNLTKTSTTHILTTTSTTRQDQHHSPPSAPLSTTNTHHHQHHSPPQTSTTISTTRHPSTIHHLKLTTTTNTHHHQQKLYGMSRQFSSDY